MNGGGTRLGRGSYWRVLRLCRASSLRIWIECAASSTCKMLILRKVRRAKLNIFHRALEL
jgi:hypothetical protein